MTPTASTTAGRRAATVPAPRRGSRTGGERIPRRVSGPVGGRAAAATAPATRPATPAPRARPAAPRLRPVAPSGANLARGILVRVRSLPDHALIDRLVRGRVWIPLLGVMLAGIVAMQVEVLKLGSSMGRWVQRGSVLASRDAELRASVATLSGSQRIERIAAGMGMEMPAPGQLDFLSVGSGAQISHALAGIHSPDAAQFIASLPTTSTQPGTPGSGLASTLATGSTTGASTASYPATTNSTTGGTFTTAASSSATTTSTGQAASPPGQTSAGGTAGGGGTAGAGGGTVATSPSSASSNSTSVSTGGSPAPTGAAGLPTTQSSGGG